MKLIYIVFILQFIINTFAFKCPNTEITIPEEYVNDGYCDCPDGADEWKTGACDGSSFTCRNEGYFMKNIPSEKYRDNICDCCDGSDERPGLCPNNCDLEAEKHLKEIESNIDELQNKLEIKNKLNHEGKQKMVKVDSIYRQLKKTLLHYTHKQKVSTLNQLEEENMKKINDVIDKIQKKKFIVNPVELEEETRDIIISNVEEHPEEDIGKNKDIEELELTPIEKAKISRFTFDPKSVQDRCERELNALTEEEIDFQEEFMKDKTEEEMIKYFQKLYLNEDDLIEEKDETQNDMRQYGLSELDKHQLQNSHDERTINQIEWGRLYCQASLFFTYFSYQGYKLSFAHELTKDNKLIASLDNWNGELKQIYSGSQQCETDSSKKYSAELDLICGAENKITSIVEENCHFTIQFESPCACSRFLLKRYYGHKKRLEKIMSKNEN